MIHLGIDFGLRHIGLSLAEGPLAAPLTQNSYTDSKKLFRFLISIVQGHQVNALVIGMPEGHLASKVKNFGNKLSSLTNLPVYYQDETLSTVEAQQKLILAHKPQKKRRLDHQAAATIILQDYLDDQPKA
jgi:putative pre-16S rRNA nuclease